MKPWYNQRCDGTIETEHGVIPNRYRMAVETYVDQRMLADTGSKPNALNLMRFSRKFKAAVNNYFAVRSRNGGTFANTFEKEKCCAAIIEAIPASYGCTILPGTIFLTIRKKQYRITKPLL